MSLLGYNGAAPDTKTAYYHIKVKKAWFRGKDAFTEPLPVYEKMFLDEPELHLPLNAGNMIYVMMQRLEIGVEWEKQDALIHSYRNLMFKLSFVDILWRLEDRMFLHFIGQKNDVMWALAFLSQVYPEEPLRCMTVSFDEMDTEHNTAFEIMNGGYVGEGAGQAQLENDALPDIWSIDMRQQSVEYQPDLNVKQYRSNEKLANGDAFALPDGRQGVYMRMNERFELAERKRDKVNLMERHNISASLIKDFEDIVRAQTKAKNYDVYRMRYVAFMNKVHELEYMMKGLEVSCYDILPIGERGLPHAEKATVDRTNQMDAGSLRYIIDKVSRNKANLHKDEIMASTKEAMLSIIGRIRGYDIEYQLYQMSGTPEDLCRAIRNNKCFELYADMAELDALGILPFPASVYKALLNEPAGSVMKMTEFERNKLRVFGRGYLDFLDFQVKNLQQRSLRLMYSKALDRLQKRYLVRGRQQ